MNRVAEQFTGARTNGPTPQQNTQPWLTSKDIRAFVGPVEKMILDYPGVALASAFIVGVTIGWLIKRK